MRLSEEVVAAKEAGPPPYKGMGHPPKERPAPLHSGESVLGDLPEEAWQTVSWREATKGPLSKQVVAVRAHWGTGSPRHSTRGHGRVSTGPEGWLIGERPLPKEGGEEEKQAETNYYYYYYYYYFSNLPKDTSLERLVEVAHTRWAIEQFYEDAKGELGLGD